MNPVEIGTGKSFKGLAAYLLHDHGKAQSADRVAWTQSFNLDDAGPDRAWRLMADTALSADQLKAAAGIKKGPRAKNTAYHFSLNFNPQDEPSEDVQRAAVASALKALGMENYQALAVGHRDTDHRHVHVMVNLINPANGVSAASKQPDGSPSKLSNTQRKLSQWAQQFEREHGLTVTEGRLENANKRAQGEQIDAKRKPRQVYEQTKNETTDRRRDYLKRGFDEKAKDLTLQGHNLREGHGIEWDALKTGYRTQKEATFQAGRQAAKDAADAIKAEHKKKWSAMFMRQRSESQDFARGEKTTLGRIWHAAAVIRDRAIDGDVLGGFLAAFSAEERKGIIDRKHQREREKLAQQIRKEISLQIRAMQREQKTVAGDSRLAYLKECAALKKRQEAERQELRELWRQLNLERASKVGRQNIQARNLQQDRERSRGMGQGRGFGLEPD